MADIDKQLDEIPTIDYPDQPYNRIISYKDKSVRLVRKRRIGDRTIRSVYVPKEIHHTIRREFMEFVSMNELNHSERLLVWDFVKELMGCFPDV